MNVCRFQQKPCGVLILSIAFLYLFWDIVFGLLEDSKFGRDTYSKIEPPPNGMDRDCRCRSISKDRHHGTHLPRYCSAYSISRGVNQKIISYSLNNKYADKFIDDIYENLENLKKYYPTYVMRVYHNLKSPIMETEAGKQICTIYCSENQMDLCNVRSLDTYRNLVQYDWSFWRLTPMIDPLVVEFHSRDLNARISKREADAVRDWVSSGTTYHVMRDHPSHDYKILGGMFGMKYRNKNAVYAKKHFEKMLLRTRRKWRPNIDRDMLSKYVWPKAKYDMVAHDSYLCTKSAYSYRGNKPWPSKRIDGENQNFVGSRVEDDIISLTTVGQCPIKCRPKQYEEWLLC